MTKKEYRSKIRIYADILRTISEERGKTRPTRILYGANLSHDRLVKYLGELKDLKLIVETKERDKTLYSLTNKGWEFLREFKRIERFAEAFGIAI